MALVKGFRNSAVVVSLVNIAMLVFATVGFAMMHSNIQKGNDEALFKPALTIGALAICLALTILLSQLSSLFVLRCVVCVCMYVCMCRCVRMRVAPTCRRHCLRASAHVAGTLSSARRAEVLQVLLYAASCRHCL